MVAGRLRVLAVVEAVEPGLGRGVSLEFVKMTAGKVAEDGEDINGRRAREVARMERPYRAVAVGGG
jgi:hypothetical protein